MKKNEIETSSHCFLYCFSKYFEGCMALFNSMKNTSRSLLKKLCCKATRNFFPARYLTIAKNVFTIDVTIECTISTYRFDEPVPVFDENNAFSNCLF